MAELTPFPSIGSCGSYLDGGASHAFQEAAVPMLEPSLVHTEMVHLQQHFRVGSSHLLYNPRIRPSDILDRTSVTLSFAASARWAS